MTRPFFLFFLFFPFFCSSQFNVEHTIYFDTDEYFMVQTEKARLFSFVKALPKRGLLKIEISGFCDDVGAENYNLVLSQTRANAIREVFSSLSFFPDKIVSVDGKGEVLLNVYPSDDPEIVRSLNRRVDVVVSYLDPATVSETNLKDSSGPIVLNNVHFISGYSYLTRGSKEVLSALAKTLTKESFSFVIQGHVCCTEGKIDAIDKRTKERNLSVARAKYVYDYFLEKGIEKSRMSYEGFGHRFPLGGSADKDRRVEIVVFSD
jgi:outer membrane protein OmpA-like peptidoglycan-associated protein